jgi:PAS domain S-box-containing protein
MFTYAGLDYFIYSPATGFTLAIYATALIALLILFQKRIITYKIAVTVLAVVTIFYTMPCVIYFSGGIVSPVAACYIIVPMGALLLAGMGYISYILTGICVLYFITLTILKINHFPFPPFNKQFAAIGALLDYSGLTILVFLLTSLYEKQKAQTSVKLEQEKELFVKHTRQVPGVIFQLRLNADGTPGFNFLSENAYEVTGYHANQIIKDAWLYLNLIDADDFTKVTTQLYASAQTMTYWEHEYKITLPNGTVKWMKGSARPEQKPDGTTVWYGYVSDVTGEREASKNFLQTKQNFEEIIDTINDVSYLYDIINKKYLFISPNCKTMLGVDADFFYRGNDYNSMLVHPEDKEKMLTATKQVNNGFSYDIDFRLVIDGHVKWLNEKSYPIKNSNGDTIRNSGVITDITYRKLTEQKLLETQANISQINSTINDTFFLYDCTENKYLYISPNCLNTLGVTDSFFYEGNNYSAQFAYEEDKQKLADAYNNITNGSYYEIDYRTVINNKIRWLKEKSYPIKNASGNTIKISGVVTDVTDKKIAEEKQEKAQKALEEAQELANIGSWEFDFSTNTSTWSKEMFKIFNVENVEGLDYSAAVKKRLFSADVPLLDAYVQNLLEGKSINDQEFRVQAGADILKYVSVTANALRNTANKQISGLRAVFQDVTKQKLAAMAKSNFLSTMSHEIRTPINGVIGIANLLQDEALTPTQKEYVDTLSFSAQHLSTIVSDILDFSKIESGSFTFEKVSFNLEQVASNIFKLFESKAIEKNISLSFSPTKIDEFSLYGDYVRLSQVLTNLLSNAVKFTQKGGVAFGYNVKKETPEKIIILFAIKDSGIGIPVNQQKRIFESFLQADDTVTRKYGGTGLGLTISKKLVEMQGGKISLESIYGKGSTFYVEMTFDKHILPTETDIEIGNKKDKLIIPGMKVLVAEDNKINAMVLTRFLNNWQIKSTLAKDGQEVIDILEKENFDAILMDLQMPIMDGRQAAKLIRQLPNDLKNKIPIIALTADALVESQQALLINGFNECVTKPFSPDVLFRILKKYYN